MYICVCEHQTTSLSLFQLSFICKRRKKDVEESTVCSVEDMECSDTQVEEAIQTRKWGTLLNPFLIQPHVALPPTRQTNRVSHNVSIWLWTMLWVGFVLHSMYWSVFHTHCVAYSPLQSPLDLGGRDRKCLSGPQLSIPLHQATKFMACSNCSPLLLLTPAS